MLRIKLDNAANKRLFQQLKNAPKKIDKAIGIALERVGEDMRSRAISLAPYKSGNLRRSITKKVTGKSVIVGTNLVYAPIHDLGGVIPAHTITPRNSQVLRFIKNGKVVFAKRVHLPARTQQKYKGRGYLTPAFEEMKSGGAQKIFREEILSALGI